MILRLKINQVISIGNGLVRLILVRPSLKARVQPLQQSDEQRITEDISAKLQQTLGSVFPGGVIVDGSAPIKGQWDTKIDMTITEEEYEELGKPGINDKLEMNIKKE